MAEDWDLHAVVRGCSTVASSSVSSSSSPSSSGFASCYFHPEAAVSSSSSSSSSGFNIFKGEQGISQVLSLSAYPFEARSSIEELHELCKPFFSKSQPLTLQASSPLSSLSSYSSAPPKSVSTQEKQQQRSKQAHAVTTPRSKRRKNQLKKVCQVPVENLSSDIWAWRKYGQKPIKGSPYPRGYYRCSSSKGCLARKQVERNRSDPTMFIVTYTAEHNHPAPTHRNSLAGSTRQKPLVPQSATTTEEDSDKSKSLTKPTSPTTSGAEEEAPTPPQGEKSESREEKEDVMDDEEEDEFCLSDMVLSDDFFESLDELSQLTAPSVVTGDCFSDPFSAIAIPSWVASGAATAGGCR